MPKNPIKPKLMITAEVSGTTANSPHKARLKKRDAKIPMTSKEAKILTNDDRTIRMTKSLKTTIIPVTSIFESSLKFLFICSFNLFV